MANNENQCKKIYLPHDKMWIEVDYELYLAYYRPIWAARKRAQAHGQCSSTQSTLWLCDGDCFGCPFHSAGDSLSLDYPYTNSNGEEYNLLDQMRSTDATPEEAIADASANQVLLWRLEQLMPHVLEIAELRLQGFSDSEIAERIGMKRTTFLYQLKRAKEILRAEYPDLLQDLEP